MKYSTDNTILDVSIESHDHKSVIDIVNALHFYLVSQEEQTDYIQEGEGDEVGLLKLPFTELRVNGENIIDFINKNKLLLKSSFYTKLYYGDPEGIEAIYKNLKLKYKPSDGLLKEHKFFFADRRVEEIDFLDNKDRWHGDISVKHTHYELDDFEPYDSESSDEIPIYPDGFSRDYYLTAATMLLKYLQYSDQDATLKFDIKDDLGYTPLGVASLSDNKISIATPGYIDSSGDGFSLFGYDSSVYQVFRDLIGLADHSGIKLTPDLRIVEGKEYVNLIDLMLSNGVFSEFTHYVYNLIEWSETFFEKIDLLLKERDDLNKIIDRLDTSKINSKDLAIVAFKDEGIFKKLVLAITSSIDFGCEQMEFSQLFEDFRYATNLHYVWKYGGASILGNLSDGTVSDICKIVVENNLTYDPTKLNPLNGYYSCIGGFTYVYEHFNVLLKLADLFKASFEVNSFDDWGINYVYHLNSHYQDFFLDIASSKGEIVDLHTNMNGLEIDIRNLKYKEKLEHFLSWDLCGIDITILNQQLTEHLSLEYIMPIKEAWANLVKLDISSQELAHKYWERIEYDDTQIVIDFIDDLLERKIEIHIHKPVDLSGDDSESESMEEY